MQSKRGSVKPTISIGQALLILIDKNKNDPFIYQQLTRIYFLGANSKEDEMMIKKQLNDPAITQYYSVSLPPTESDDKQAYDEALENHYKTISNDPSRRYFETTLAFQTLLTKPMQDIELSDLEKHCAYLESMLPTTDSVRHLYSETEQKTLPKTVLQILNNILEGDMRHVKDKVTTDQFSGNEYSDAINKLESKDHYTDFSDLDKKKMALMVRCSFLCVNIIRHNQSLPMSKPVDIYSSGFYAPENRGVIKKDSYNHNLQSSNLGLMLSYMWVPSDDKEKTNSVSPYPRVADRNTFKPSASWPQDNFGYLTHPFSCAISGTMLIFHKVFKQLQLDNQFLFDTPEKYIQYIKTVVPLLLYNSGGHTFHEFLYPLRLDAVREAFSFIKGFNDINNQTLFIDSNEEAFNQAIEKAIEYNNTLLARKRLHSDIEERTVTLKSTAEFKQLSSPVQPGIQQPPVPVITDKSHHR